MTHGPWIAMGALLGLMASAVAQADFTTIDADPYTPGTDVSNAFDGVTLSHITWASGAYQSTPAYSASCGTAPNPFCNSLGVASLGWQTPTGGISQGWTVDNMTTVQTCLVDPTYAGCESVPQHILELSFDTETDFIQFDATYRNNNPAVLAFDAAGNVVTLTAQVTYLQSFTGSNLFGHQLLTLTSATANIKRLWIAGDSGRNSYVNIVHFQRPATTCPVEEPSDITTIDADLYSAGTDISNVFEHVALSHITWVSGGYQSTPVYPSSCGTAPNPFCDGLGLAAFAWPTGTGTYNRNWTSDGMATVRTCLTNPTASRCASVPQHLLELSFDTETDFIQFDSTYGSDRPDVLAFDAAGNVVTVTKQTTTLQNYTASTQYGHQSVKVTSASANIKRLWVAGNGGGYATVNVVSFKRPATCSVEAPSE